MLNQKKFVILLTEGIGLRNFFMTRFLSLLCNEGEVIFWYALPEQIVHARDHPAGDRVRWQPLPKHREGQLPYLFRRAKLAAQLYWQNTPGTDIVLKRVTGKGKGVYKLRNRLAEALGRAYSRSHDQILWLDAMHARAVRQSRYFVDFLEFLKFERPDAVFCTHQRSPLAIPAMLAARQLGIPSATFIYSWDNLPKGRMAVHADYFLVWSQHMKDEMRNYYPDVAEERIFVTGTPQFEHYFNSALLEPRLEFLRRYGLDPSRPVVCFSGDDLDTSPYDPQYLADLAEELQSIPLAERPQIIFRRCPTDNGDRYRSVLERYPEIANIEPQWFALANNDWSKVIPTQDDVKLLVNTVAHSDAVINVGSTMAVDFAILNKPAIYLAYNPSGWKASDAWNIDQVYRFPHFNPMQRFEPVAWCRSKEELRPLVMQSLQDPQCRAENRRAWLEFLAQTPLDRASDRCVEALLKISQKRKTI